MAVNLKPISRALCLLSLSVLTNHAFAAVSSSSTSTVTVAKMAAEEKQLQQQMQTLQAEMAQLQQQQKILAAQTKPVSSSSTVHRVVAPPETINTTHAPSPAVTKHSSTTNKTDQTAYQQNVGPQQVKVESANGTKTKIPYGGTTLGNIGGFAVITSPYLHPQTAYSGGDLIVNFSSINKDASMLQQRQEFQEAMSSLGFGMPSSGSLLELSGEVESDVVARRTFTNGNQTDLYVGDAELDMEALINRWITAFMDFSYNNAPNDVGDRVGGDIVLDNGFLVFGNLNASPWRLTMGQLYVPFGQFNSYLISDPINKTLFRTKGQPIIVGYGVPGTPGFSGAVYTFKGISTEYGETDMSNPYINQYGADANYQFNLGQVQATFGASYIANVADSYGFQFPGYDDPEYGNIIVGDGFSTSTETEHLQHQVPGVDLRAMFGTGPFSLIGEYDTVTESFSSQDLSFNGHAASPKAYHIEGVYSFSMLGGKPSTVSIGYDQSYQALGLAVPQSRIAAAINTSFWRNTLASLEVRHDNAYSEDDTAGGNGAVVTSPEGDGSANQVTLQFQVYF